VVERYSKTVLTKEKDKLIALSGIAQMMASQIRGRYIAGMWEKYLASQLLWRVDPKYENGCFTYPSKRHKPESYRAPSFSWAAVDAPQGVKCGETTREKDLFIAVEKINVTTKPDSLYGLVEKGCYLELTCSLKRIEMWFREKKGTTHYVWNLAEGSKEEMDRKHDNVYLDSPDNDFESIQGPHGQLYCVPARKNSKDYLICLLLQLVSWEDPKRCFRRVGLTIIPPFEGGQEDLISPDDGIQGPIWGNIGRMETIRIF
jgi:hypothetical protein